VVLGRPVYGSAHKSRFIRWVHGRFYAADKLIWQARYRLQKKHRYHLVDTGLEPSYYDEDYRMLHACMAILVEHVERGHGGVERLDEFTHELATEPRTWGCSSDEMHPQVTHQSEVAAIYRWWTEERPLNEATEAFILNDVYGGRDIFDRSKDEPRERMWTHDDYSAYEDKLRKDDQDMLHRLIEIRPGLWT
jgi:hypothetical protein